MRVSIIESGSPSVGSNIHSISSRHRLSVGGSEKIQLTALLGAFKYAVELSQKR